ncbi:MAG TPA: hypothetical protein VMH35_17410 [Streptosporangiaceae bacterium]|nr:hypothetical protein [Streptosporangiaceae bacterium]
MVAIVVLALVVVFAAGAVVAVTAMVCYGIRREERNFSLTQRAPGRLSAGARTVTGLYVRQRADCGPAVTRKTDSYA